MVLFKGQFVQTPDDIGTLSVTANFKKDPLEEYLIISHKNHKITFLKREVSEKSGPSF